MLLYTPSGFPQAAWRPVITSVTLVSGRTYTVTGTQLNGLTTGAALGDDGGFATNYPLVRIRQSSGQGQIFFCATSNFNNMAPGQTTQFQFTCSSSIPSGSYSLAVVASGVASGTKPFNL
jgi:hypothetical protein